MIRKLHETVKKEGIAGGEGPGTVTEWLAGEELCPNAELVANVTLEPGSTVGQHPHNGEAEIYHIYTGSGEYNDNGKTVNVQAGDTTICYDGETHGLVNTGNDTLGFYAIIIKG